MRVAGGSDLRPEPGGSDVGHRAHRLRHHRRDVFLRLEHGADERGAHPAARLVVRLACGVGIPEGIAVAVVAGHVLAARQQRPGRPGAEQRLAAHARRPESGAVERIPERHRLEATGGGPRHLERDLHRVGTAGREEDFPEIARRHRGQAARQRHRRLAGESTRREGEVVELLLDGGDEARVAVADVVHGVAVEVHEAPAGVVLDPDPLRLADRGEAGRGHGLVQEEACVFLEQSLVPGARGVLAPAPAQGGEVRLSFRLRRLGSDRIVPRDRHQERRLPDAAGAAPPPRRHAPAREEQERSPPGGRHSQGDSLGSSAIVDSRLAHSRYRGARNGGPRIRASLPGRGAR